MTPPLWKPGYRPASTSVICPIFPSTSENDSVTIDTFAPEDMKTFKNAIRASVDALCRDGADLISRERVQRGRLTRQGTRS